MQVIEQRLYRKVLVIDKRRLEQETTSFRGLPFGGQFASGIEKLLNCLSLKLGPDWLEIKQKLFHGLVASGGVFAQGTLDDGSETYWTFRREFGGRWRFVRPECCV